MARFGLGRRLAVASVGAALVAGSLGCTGSGGSAGSAAAADAAGKDAAATVDSGQAADSAKSGDTAAVGDASSGADGTADAGSKDTGSAGGQDIAVQDTGASQADIAKNLADAKKAEADLYTAFCKLNFKCDTGLAYTNLDACRDELLASGGLIFFGDGLKAIAAGRAKFDASKLAGCIATMDDKCTFLKEPRLPAACSGLFAGQIDAGFQCDRGEDCKTGYCKKNAVNDNACPGACAAPGKAGAKCEDDAACEVPNVCTDALTCGAYKPAQKGEDCSNTACADGLICLDDGTNVTCVTPVAEKGTCFPGDGSCQDGLYCLSKDSQSEGKCTGKLAAGKSCDKAAWYSGATENPCVKDYVCVDIAKDATQATCEPVVALGKPCKSGDQCKGADEECSGPKGAETTCNYLPAKGADCEPLTQDDIDNGFLACLPPFVCSKAGKCVDRPGPDADCIEDKCAADLWCDVNASKAGKCKTFGKSGEACTTFQDESSSCGDGLVCGAKSETCQAPVCK